MSRLVNQRPRRALLVAGAACAVATGLLRAQPSGKVVRVGFLGPPSRDANGRELLGQLRVQMERLGWNEGSRVQYVLGLPGEWDTIEASMARIATVARELVAARVDLIVAMSTPCAVAAKAATTTIPIVFLAEEPVENGLVKSLARPGGNATGATFHVDLLAAKRIQLLKQAFPAIRRIAYLEMSETSSLYRADQAAAKALDVELLLAMAERAEDIERAFNSVPHADAWIIEDYATFAAHKEQVVGLVARSRKPAMYGDRFWVEAGGLMAYADDRADWPRRVAGLADRVLRGARPAELPVDEPTRFLLVINRKTARALGVPIAQSVLLQADEVIE